MIIGSLVISYALGLFRSFVNAYWINAALQLNHSSSNALLWEAFFAFWCIAPCKCSVGPTTLSLASASCSYQASKQNSVETKGLFGIISELFLVCAAIRLC